MGRVSQSYRFDWKERFLEALETTGKAVESCRIAGVTPCRAYQIRSNQPEFAASWRAALARYDEKTGQLSSAELDILERQVSQENSKRARLIKRLIIEVRSRRRHAERNGYGN